MLLREAMSEFGVKAVDAWWSGLDEEARGEVIALWLNAGGGSEAGCEVRVEGRIAERDAETGDDDSQLWHDDFYEYLVNHELKFDLEKPLRVFHICTQLAEARAAVKAGFIPGDFRCPEVKHDCPMKGILEFTGGRGVRLRVAFVARVEG